MTRCLLKARNRLRACLGFAVIGVPFCLPLLILPRAQPLVWRHRKANDSDPPQSKGESASQPPAFSIPVEPLGFSAPGAFYLGQRESLVSLDFLDENRLL